MLMPGSKSRGTIPLIALGFVGAAGTAQAADTPATDYILDGRFRYEFVDQDRLSEANGVNFRLRLGVDHRVSKSLSVLAEAEAVVKLNKDFSDGVRTIPGKGLITDPEAQEINRLQVKYTGIDNLTATLGRQKIVWGNARFISNSSFRLNEQTFDALRLDWQVGKTMSGSYMFLDRVHRSAGDRSRNGEWNLETHVANFGLKSGDSSWNAWGLWIDNITVPTQSSATLGLGFKHKLTLDKTEIVFDAELAEQRDYGNNPATFALNYGLLTANAKRGDVSVILRGEFLEGNGVRGLAATLGAMHQNQGWANTFITPPVDGLRDVNATFIWRTKMPGSDAPLTWFLRSHRFDNDNGDKRLGSEFNAQARVEVNKHWAVEIKAAFFDGKDPRYADRNKAWLIVDMNF